MGHPAPNPWPHFFEAAKKWGKETAWPHCAVQVYLGTYERAF